MVSSVIIAHKENPYRNYGLFNNSPPHRNVNAALIQQVITTVPQKIIKSLMLSFDLIIGYNIKTNRFEEITVNVIPQYFFHMLHKKKKINIITGGKEINFTEIIIFILNLYNIYIYK